MENNGKNVTIDERETPHSFISIQGRRLIQKLKVKKKIHHTQSYL